ncbi:hypothetical protein [Azospirillum sp.]|uniref:hypothetical protein n=1 Tax=Azospirillum sp. TaxID=34012 RepID=UPI002D2CD18D|nr:hypothetical protein [Azospirillum sp.]HYD70772.1 hypothetical protein [Azospirillum sp.]
MRWVSTPESVNKGEASALAMAETVLAVAAYWGIAWAFDTHVHLLVSILVAPLLLLRSPESTKLGVELFEAYWSDETKITRYGTPKRFWLMVLLSGGSAAAVAFGLSTLWLPEISGPPLFWRALVTGLVTVYGAIAVGITIGAAVEGWEAESEVVAEAVAVLAAVVGAGAGAGVAAGAVAVAGLAAGVAAGVVMGAGVVVVANWGNVFGVLTLLVLVPYASFGMWMRSLAVRVTATLRHIISGLRSFHRNWQHTIVAVDFTRPPELVPGASFSGKILTFEAAINRFRKTKNFVEICGFVVVAPILFMPALLYRWSLKSTFWFYFPLAYLAWPHAESKERDRVWVSLLHRGRMEDFSRVAAALVVVSVVISTFLWSDWAALRNAFPQAPTLMYLLAFDLRNLAPWQWGGVASAALTAFVWGFSEKAHRSYELTGAADRNDLTILRLVTRLRTIVTLATLGVSLGYAVLALKGIDPNQLPGWLSFAKWLYGPYLPITPPP